MRRKIAFSALAVLLIAAALLLFLPRPIRLRGAPVEKTVAWNAGRLGQGESLVTEQKLSDGVLLFKDEALILAQFTALPYEEERALLARLQGCRYLGYTRLWGEEDKAALQKLLGAEPARWTLPEGLVPTEPSSQSTPYLYADEEGSLHLADEALFSFPFREEGEQPRSLRVDVRMGGQPITELPRNGSTDFRTPKDPARLDISALLSAAFGDLDSRVGGTRLAIRTDGERQRAYFTAGGADYFVYASGLSVEEVSRFLVSVCCAAEGNSASVWDFLTAHLGNVPGR